MSERPSALLQVLAPSGQRSRVPIDSVPFTIGRNSASSLVLRDNRASRQHSKILFENGAYVVEDENSRHGTSRAARCATRT
jgi:pSer/pThr/pTyr-binding forkhead associated (FHA) protein